MFNMLNQQKNGDYYKNPSFVQFEGWTLILRKKVERKAFLTKPKHENHVSQWEEHIYCAQTQKEWRLPWESEVVPFYG